MSSSTGYEPKEGDLTKKDHRGNIPTKVIAEAPDFGVKPEVVSKEIPQASQPAQAYPPAEFLRETYTYV